MCEPWGLDRDGGARRLDGMQKSGGIQASVSTNFSGEVPYYLRITHDPTANKITFWTRVTSAAWAPFGSVGASLAVDNIAIDLGAGTYVAVSAPGTAKFDSFAMNCP